MKNRNYKETNLTTTIAREFTKELEKYLGFPPCSIKATIKVNNQNLHKSKEIEIPEDIDITDVIINGDMTIIDTDCDAKVILKKAKEDEYNLEYAFLYGYFLLNSGFSKNQASKFFKELRSTIEDEKK